MKPKATVQKCEIIIGSNIIGIPLRSGKFYFLTKGYRASFKDMFSKFLYWCRNFKFNIKFIKGYNDSTLYENPFKLPSTYGEGNTLITCLNKPLTLKYFKRDSNSILNDLCTISEEEEKELLV